MRLILLSLIAILLLSACDEGRVINEKEREKVLTEDGNSSYNFAQSLRIYEESSSPQSEYNYGIVSAFSYAVISVFSLHTLDQDKNPRVDIGSRSAELTCIDATKKQICTSWTHTYNLAEAVINAPPVDFTVTLTPEAIYKLGSVDENAVLTDVALYDVYNLKFSWADRLVSYQIVKQKFLINSYLAKVPVFPFLSTEDFKSLNGAQFYWPGPPFNYEFKFIDFYSIVGKQIDFTVTYTDILTDTNKRFRYIIERL